MGRKAGSRNLGYFYRSGRGWYTQISEPRQDEKGEILRDATGKPMVAKRYIPLKDDRGNPLRNKTTPATELKAAHRRILTESAEQANTDDPDAASVLMVCDAYLAKAAEQKHKSHAFRREILFDFCYGLPPRFMPAKGKTVPKPTAADRIHKGFGSKPVLDLLPLDLDRWIQAHKNWDGGKRTKVQAVIRALNYGVESGMIPRNPLKGYKVPRNNARTTYLTPEQEAALLAIAKPELAMAIKVLIRTGARPGREFAALTARHVKDQGSRMEWVFKPGEAKNKKLRTIRITDADIISIVRQQIEKHPKGAIFRSSRGEAWQPRNLSQRFRVAKAAAERKGVEFDEDCVLYSCRHTYAKRILQGYWSGKQTNIDTLARLMGNTPQVCRDHYLQWTDDYNEPLWESA